MVECWVKTCLPPRGVTNTHPFLPASLRVWRVHMDVVLGSVGASDFPDFPFLAFWGLPCIFLFEEFYAYLSGLLCFQWFRVFNNEALRLDGIQGNCPVKGGTGGHLGRWYRQKSDVLRGKGVAMWKWSHLSFWFFPLFYGYFQFQANACDEVTCGLILGFPWFLQALFFLVQGLGTENSPLVLFDTNIALYHWNCRNFKHTHVPKEV